MASIANFAVEKGCQSAIPIIAVARTNYLAQRRFSGQAPKAFGLASAVGNSSALPVNAGRTLPGINSGPRAPCHPDAARPGQWIGGSVGAQEGNIRNHRHDESLLSLALLSEGSLTCEAQLIPAQEGQVQIPEAQTPIPTFADGGHLKQRLGCIQLGSLEKRSVFKGHSDIFGIFGRSRSLQKFLLSKWLLRAPVAKRWMSRCDVHNRPHGRILMTLEPSGSAT